MSKASGRGKTGEDHVCGYLEKHGWKIAARNYRVKGGEIDIVAEKNGIRAVIARSTSIFRTGAVGFMPEKVLIMSEKGPLNYQSHL